MKVYLVCGARGQYDDYTEWTICVCKTAQRANELVNKLTELQEFNIEFHKTEAVTFQQQYLVSYPIPEVPKRPRERDFNNRTKESSFNFHLNRWNTAYEEASKLREKHRLTMNQAREDWFKENYKPAEHLLEVVKFSDYNGTYLPEETHFNVDETEMID